MPFLPGLAVVFVGILDGGHAKVDHQVKAIVKELHVAAKVLPTADLQKLTRHKPGTAGVVKKLHGEGVISFEVVGGKELRLVTYDGEGVLKTYLELTLEGGALTADDASTVRDSIADDFSLQHAAPAPAAEPEIEIDTPPLQKAVAKPTPVAAVPAVAHKATASTMTDDEMPTNLGKRAPAKASPPPAPAPAEAPATDKPEHDAAAVDIAEIEAATGADAPANETEEVHATAIPSVESLHLGASLGFGITGRLFSPGPSTITGYSSTPVGMIAAEGHISPTANTRLRVIAEKTVSMSTPMDTGSMAPTSIARWEATGGYVVTHGSVEIAPQVGIGRRTFSIDSNDPSRTPDGEYNYLIAGVAAHMPLGEHLSLRGAALFEPVVSGAEPTEMALGDATRWAFDVGASVELRFTHVFARVGADWQRFSWSWDMAGAAGAGGAVDNYGSGTLSVGADY
jgi:hypothetical protein